MLRVNIENAVLGEDHCATQALRKHFFIALKCLVIVVVVSHDLFHSIDVSVVGCAVAFEVLSVIALSTGEIVNVF